jgi:hypothetical protein
MGFPDPAKATGSDGEIIAVFRKIRDDITKQVLEFLRSYLQQ